MRVHRVFAELLGTVVVAFCVTMKRGDPVAMGAGLWCAIIGTGFVSGGQFNPAITMSVFLANCYFKEVKAAQVFENVAYVLCHFLGAMLGSLLSWELEGDTWQLMISPGHTEASGFMAEACGTTVLVLVAQVSAMLRDDAFIGTIAVASAYYLGGLTLRSISGGCLNPAIGVAANFVDSVHYGSSRSVHMWIYVCAPFTGALVAAALFIVLRPELEKFHKKRRMKGAARAVKK